METGETEKKPTDIDIEGAYLAIVAAIKKSNCSSVDAIDKKHLWVNGGFGRSQGQHCEHCLILINFDAEAAIIQRKWVKRGCGSYHSVRHV